MKVVLQTAVKGLGEMGDVTEVAPGFFTNFLAPRGKAVPADAPSLTWAQKVQSNRVARKEELLKNAAEFAKKLDGQTLTFKRKTTGDDGKLFGAVTEKDIAQQLLEQHKLDLEKKQVKLEKHLKEVGESKVEIQFSPGIVAKITVNVESEE